MDGKKLTRLVLDALDEDSVSDRYADQRKIYECLDEAAGIFCREAMILHASATLTTVEDQQAYDLPPGFVALFMKTRYGRYFIKYSDGTYESFPRMDTYESLYRAKLTESQDIPSRFALIDKGDKESVIEGTATGDGAASGGECILVDTGKSFTTTHMVHSRDVIHNITDGSDGFVLSVTDATHLVVALFDGTDNDITSGDAYVIQPAAEQQVFLDAPSSTAGHTITVPYVCMPDPVFSNYGFWRFSPRVSRAIAAGAAGLFKTPKREFTEARMLGGLFTAELRRTRNEIAASAIQTGVHRSIR